MFEPQPRSDSELDAQLRDVPLPEGMLERLGQLAVAREEQIDQALRQVSVPEGMLERLQQVVADEKLNESLREVALPQELLPRLFNIPLQRPHRPLVAMALAASLMLVLGGAYLSAIGALLGALRPAPVASVPLVIAEPPALALAAEVAESELSNWLAVDEAAPSHWPLLAANQQAVQLLELEDRWARGPAGQLLAEIDTGLPLGEDVLLLRWGPLGAPHAATRELPVLEMASLPRLAAVPPPLVRGYDRKFWLRHGIHPPVFPAADEQLHTSLVPLATGTDTYQRVRQMAAENRWPSPAEIRVEDFLAALDYRFPLPQPGQLGIRTAAGPAIFGAPGTGLLQVGVQAGELPQRDLPATHMMVALDISASMQSGERLERARGALARVLDCLSPADRFSLVVFHDEVVHQAKLLGAGEAAELLHLLNELRPQGGANLGAGLQQAVSVALESGQQEWAQRLVLITDGRGVMPREATDRLERLLEMGAEQGLRMVILDVNEQQPARSDLVRLAAAARGQVHQVRTAEQVYWGLLEALTGRQTVIATEAVLRVTFNPQAVAAYRLLGHEATLLGEGSPAVVETELHVGQAATALFEIWLQAGTEDDVAMAEVVWKEPGSGQTRRVQQRISRLQFATSFVATPLSLQAAVFAAETGEVLRESFQFELESSGGFSAKAKPRSLQGVLEAAGGVNRQLAERPDFQRFLRLVEHLERVRYRQTGE